MTQKTSKKIEGVIVYWDGAEIQYLLPSGFNGNDFREFMDRNKKTIEALRKDWSA